MNQRFNINRLWLMLGIMAVSIGLDRITKIWATNTLVHAPTRTYLGDTFRLLYVENTGAFLSLGSDLPDSLRLLLLTILPVALLLGLFFYTLFSQSMFRAQVIAFSFILAGGFSNVVDRILAGSVVDFMNIGIGSLRTGIFNVADMSIMLGLFIMLPYLFRKPAAKEEETTEPPVEETHTSET